jgi:hypothetical protein
MSLKTCIKCKRELPLEEFHVRNPVTGLRRTECKKCLHAQNWARRKQKYATDPEHRASIKQYKNKYRQRPEVQEKVKAYRRQHYYAAPAEQRKIKNRENMLKAKFGITAEFYDALLVAQRGVCAICGKPETEVGNHGEVRPLAVDHDHKTGKVRGLLCNKCNPMLGMANDEEIILIKAAAYLRERR